MHRTRVSQPPRWRPSRQNGTRYRQDRRLANERFDSPRYGALGALPEASLQRHILYLRHGLLNDPKDAHAFGLVGASAVADSTPCLTLSTQSLLSSGAPRSLRTDHPPGAHAARRNLASNRAYLRFIRFHAIRLALCTPRARSGRQGQHSAWMRRVAFPRFAQGFTVLGSSCTRSTMLV